MKLLLFNIVHLFIAILAAFTRSSQFKMLESSETQSRCLHTDKVDTYCLWILHIHFCCVYNIFRIWVKSLLLSCWTVHLFIAIDQFLLFFFSWNDNKLMTFCFLQEYFKEDFLAEVVKICTMIEWDEHDREGGTGKMCCPVDLYTTLIDTLIDNVQVGMQM